MTFLRLFDGDGFKVAELQGTDIDRMAELVETYLDLPLGIVDAAVAAIAERLGADRARARECAWHPTATSYDRRVARWDPVQPHHVRQAAAEYDERGPDEFLARYGFGPARAYLLMLDGKRYDSKAILGVAYKYATGRALGPHDFSGGVHGAVGVLSALGFEIANIRDRSPSK